MAVHLAAEPATPQSTNGVVPTPKKGRTPRHANGLPNGNSTKKVVQETPMKAEKVAPEVKATPSQKKKKEMTLGEKLAAQNREKGKPASAAKLAMGEGSMAMLLTQGLIARDDEKIDAVLREERPEIIFKTIHDLQSIHIIPILKLLDQRLRTRSATNITPWLKWIRSIFNVHMGYLTSVSTVESEIASLLDWLKSRVAHQTKIFEINEKLNVILDQIERRNKKSFDTQQPLVIFGNEDSDGSEDDLESLVSEGSGEGSEAEWWNDEDGDGASSDDDSESDDQLEDDSDADLDAVISKRRRLADRDNGSESGEDENEGEEGDVQMESDDSGDSDE